MKTEDEQSPGSPEFNSAFKVFWKSKQWSLENSSFISDDSSLFKRKHFRAKRSRRWKHSKDGDEPLLLTLPCSLCKQETDVAGIFFHRKHHAALAALGFQWMGGKNPQPSVIAVQRQFIVSKLLSSGTLSEKVLGNLNNAAEVLLKKPVPRYYKILDSTQESSVHRPPVCHLLIKGLAVCRDRNSTWKADMNDKFTVVDNFGNKPNVCFLGLFDGHLGPCAADAACEELPALLLHQLCRLDASYEMTRQQRQLVDSLHTVFREEYTAIEDRFSSTHRTPAQKHEYEDLHKAFAKAFWRMDRLLRLGRKEASRVRWSGCSAVACVLESNTRRYGIRSRRRTCDPDGLAEGCPAAARHLVSGVLHIANTGNVQALLCRNGKGFCLTKEHTTRNIKERRRVLQAGAVISSNEPYGLLEGQVRTTRGLGFHGNPKLKKSIIPAPQTISVPIDDLCQFLILATNGLWEVLDKKEVTALVITLFHMYKKACSPIILDKMAPFKGPLLSDSGTNTTGSESSIHVLFQYHSLSKEGTSAAKLTNLSDHNYYDYAIPSPKNVETFPSEMTNHEPGSERDIDKPSSADYVQACGKDAPTKIFHEGAAEYVSRELVNAALEAGSRDNITVIVMFLNGTEYQLLA